MQIRQFQPKMVAIKDASKVRLWVLFSRSVMFMIDVC
jgi:hypothetical protein